jgi:hypothetical protein
MAQKTRKIKVKKVKHEKSMTIPELRKAFEHVETFTHKHDYNVEEYVRLDD